MKNFTIYPLTYIPPRNIIGKSMWRIQATLSWQASPYVVAPEDEALMGALLRNLERFVALLKAAREYKPVEAGYLRREVSSIASIDSTGLVEDGKDTRIYAFIDGRTHIVYLLGVSTAATKDADMEYYKQTVITLAHETTAV